MRLVDLARRAVLRTNQWPGFESLYLRAYDLGLAFTVRRLRSVPGVLAVLLRANDDGNRWAPGSSDYDVSVLVERHDGPGTLLVLDALWRRYRSIKKLMPQLGEMEVMNVEEFEDVLSFGPLPISSLKRAYPLYVRRDRPDVDRVLHRSPRPVGEPELLLDAISRYSRFAYPSWLHGADSESEADRRRTVHLLANVSKRLARLGMPVETFAHATTTDRMIQVFRALSQACSRTRSSEGDSPVVVDPDVSSIPAGALPPLEEFCEQALRRAALHHASAVAWISYMTVDRLNLVFVVPDDVEPDALRRLLDILKAERRTAEALLKGASTDSGGPRRSDPPAFPNVASESIWRCWRELSPFDGAAIAANGRTIAGDTGRSHAAPSRAATRRGAEVQYAALLALKNNWRLSRGRPTGESYAALVNHAKGYASALTGRVRTAPEALELASTQDGYLAAEAALKALRASLER